MQLFYLTGKWLYIWPTKYPIPSMPCIRILDEFVVGIFVAEVLIKAFAEGHICQYQLVRRTKFVHKTLS